MGSSSFKKERDTQTHKHTHTHTHTHSFDNCVQELTAVPHPTGAVWCTWQTHASSGEQAHSRVHTPRPRGLRVVCDQVSGQSVRLLCTVTCSQPRAGTVALCDSVVCDPVCTVH